MKRLLTLLVLTLAVTGLCFASSVTGYVTDAKCANGGKAGEAHAKCAAGCIKGGEAAVVVTADGKIYEVAQQDKVTGHAGAKVTVTGKVEGTKITSIESVEKAS